MRLIVTLRELLDMELWCDFCKIRQMDEWFAEANPYEYEFTLTKVEALKLGITITVIDKRIKEE